MSKISGMEDLRFWQSARNLAQGIDSLVKRGGLAKNKTLEMQLQRSSISVVSNIAEGFGRGGNKEFINFLSIARGSIAEVLSPLILAYDFGYCNEDEYFSLRVSIENTGKLIGGLTRHLKNSTITGSKFQ